MTTITINTKNRTIEITKTFATAASKFGSPEYTELKEARLDNPTYRVVTIVKKNCLAYNGFTENRKQNSR